MHIKDDQNQSALTEEELKQQRLAKAKAAAAKAKALREAKKQAEQNSAAGDNITVSASDLSEEERLKKERLEKAKAAAAKAKALRETKKQADNADQSGAADESASELSEEERLKKERLEKAKAAAAKAKALREAKKKAENAEQSGAVSDNSTVSASDLSEEERLKKERLEKAKAAAAKAKALKEQKEKQSGDTESAAEELSEVHESVLTQDMHESASGKNIKTGGACGIQEESLFAEVTGEKQHSEIKKVSLWELFIRGIWKENPGLCQLLGMCPLLAVTTSAANALGLGAATIVVMILSSVMISLLRRFIMQEVRIPLYVVIIASLVTVVRSEVEAYFPELYRQLGIYLSLIVTNCIIMARAEAFAGRNNLIRSFVDAAACSLGFTMVLFALGCIRELIGNGTIFTGAADLLGPWAADLEIRLAETDSSFLIAILPPGGFFVLALLIAFKNAADNYSARRKERKFIIRSEKL